jgi:hypothetical protein
VALREAYLEDLLDEQTLTSHEIGSLKGLRAQVERVVGEVGGGVRFRYGGSLAKGTMIAESYDLDILAYWPDGLDAPLRSIFELVGAALTHKWPKTIQKNVAWRVPFGRGVCVDVVPARLIDPVQRSANLYRCDTDTTRKTNLERHVGLVRESGRADVIRLLKLWKIRRALEVPSFALEVIALDACRYVRRARLGPQLRATWEVIVIGLQELDWTDPVNSNNVVTERLTARARATAVRAATHALAAKDWREVFE